MRVGIKPQTLIGIYLKSLYIWFPIQSPIAPSTSDIRLEWLQALLGLRVILRN